VDVDLTDAGTTHETMCDDVVASHSDYLDGLLPAHEAARVQWHLASCASCARYDRVVRRGGELLRDLPAITPSDDFADRLQHRIYHLQDAAAVSGPRAGGAAATFAVASVIALLAWSPLYFNGGGADDAAVALESYTLSQPPFLPAPALLGSAGEVWLSAPVATPLGNADPMHVLAAFPGPHSPLVVNPPVHRTVRTISAEYTPFE
jgi:anti-sigma factor RsiW